MQTALDELREILAEVPARLAMIDESDSRVKPAPEKWSKIEILGHLIDSATNNHVRFVLAQIQDEMRGPRYEQESWARVQNHQGASWPLMVELWTAFNRHLCHVIESIREDRYQVQCYVADLPPMSLDELVADYVDHMKHHLRQILGQA